MSDRDALLDRLIEAAREREADGDDLHLKGWDRARWETLLARATVVELGPGEVLIKRDAPGQALYFLVEGVLEVSTPRSDEITFSPIATILPGSVVGEIAFLDHGHRSASVWPRERATLFRLSQEDFEALMEAEPRLAAELLVAVGQILAARLRRLLGSRAGDAGRRGS